VNWWLIGAALAVSLAYRLGGYVALRRAGIQVQWRSPLSLERRGPNIETDEHGRVVERDDEEH
jgi:hypothetical protein